MRILANENVPAPVVAGLLDAGHDVLWVREQAPASSDLAVVSMAMRDERLILTLDKDYGRIVFGLGRIPPGLILARLGTLTIAAVTRALLKGLAARDDWLGHFSVIEPGRVRMIELPEAN